MGGVDNRDVPCPPVFMSVLRGVRALMGTLQLQFGQTRNHNMSLPSHHHRSHSGRPRTLRDLQQELFSEQPTTSPRMQQVRASLPCRPLQACARTSRAAQGIGSSRGLVACQIFLSAMIPPFKVAPRLCQFHRVLHRYSLHCPWLPVQTLAPTGARTVASVCLVFGPPASAA